MEVIYERCCCLDIHKSSMGLHVSPGGCWHGARDQLSLHGKSVRRGRATAAFKFANEEDQRNHCDRQPTDHAKEKFFHGHESHVEDLVLDAWNQRMLISVTVDGHSDWPAKIVLLRP